MIPWIVALRTPSVSIISRDTREMTKQVFFLKKNDERTLCARFMALESRIITSGGIVEFEMKQTAAT